MAGSRRTEGLIRVRQHAGRALLLLAALVISACGGPNANRAYLLAEGDWGWGGGKGCAGRADVISIDGDGFDIYLNGERVDRGLFQRRSINSRGGTGIHDGAVDSVTWSYVARHPEDPGKLVRIEERFMVVGRFGSIRSIAAPPNIRITDPETGETERIRNPRAGERLARCPDGEPQ